MSNLLLLVGLSSGFAHSVYSAISKSLLKNRIKEPFLLLFYINLFQAFLTPFLWLFIRPAFPPLAGWTPLTIAGLTGLIAFMFLYMALSCGDASSVMPILGSKVIFAGLLAIPLLDENHGWPVYLAAVLVAVSIALLSYSPSISQSNTFPLKPILLMVGCSISFAFTDIYINKSLAFVDPYNFMIYYNLILGVGSLLIIPYLRRKKISLNIDTRSIFLSLISSVLLISATLLFVTSLNLANGVVVPNILISTRGIFIVLISAVLSHRGRVNIESQTKKVYFLRFAASNLIILSIWMVLS